MNQHFQWDAYRYVLDDPSLDREAFEARMLDDVALATAVASAMAEIEMLQVAGSSLPSAAANQPVAHLPGVDRSQPIWPWLSLCSLAATLLLAVGLSLYGWFRRLPGDSISLATQSQTAVAERWLALRETTSENAGQDEMELAEESLELSATAELAMPEDDWLLEAAREFYRPAPASDSVPSPGAAS